MMEKYGKTALIDDLAATTDLTRAQIETVLEAALAQIQQQVCAGKAVTLLGFGTWRQAPRAARAGINPHTKQPMEIPASTAVRFIAGGAFKAAVAAAAPGYAQELAAAAPVGYAQERAVGTAAQGPIGKHLESRNKKHGRRK